MTPVFKVPSHNEKEMKSIVFCHKTPGKEVVKFYGEDHKRNAEEFCRRFHGFDNA